LRTTTEIISNRSLYSSPDYFPDFDAANNDFFESLKTKRSYFSILIERFAQSIDDTNCPPTQKTWLKRPPLTIP